MMKRFIVYERNWKGLFIRPHILAKTIEEANVKLKLEGRGRCYVNGDILQDEIPISNIEVKNIIKSIKGKNGRRK